MFRGASRLGVMGGTFDPPHNGHFKMAAAVASAKRLDHVLFVPASQPWQKAEYSHAEDRFTMTQLGAVSDPRFVVSRIELDRKGPTYTVETVSTLSELCPDVQLFFIVGADAAVNLPTWHRVGELARFVSILVVTRSGVDPSDLELPTTELQIEYVDVRPVDISSTQVRAAVRQGLSIEGSVPPAVCDYIARRGLYRAREGTTTVP